MSRELMVFFSCCVRLRCSSLITSVGIWFFPWIPGVLMVCFHWPAASDSKISNLDLPPNNPVWPVVNTGLFQDSWVDPTYNVLNMASMMIVSPISTIGFPGEGGIAVEQRDPRNGPVVEPEDQVQHSVWKSDVKRFGDLGTSIFWFNLYGGKWMNMVCALLYFF